jgi:exodeoxyribonuclease-5
VTTHTRAPRRLHATRLPKGAHPRARHQTPKPRAPRPDGLSAQQREAVDKIRAWYRGGEQVFRLFGYAGTGKTSIARRIVEELRVRAVFAAFTGKAAYVLRSKGCADASTIHSLIYLPKEAVRERLDKLCAELANQTDPAARAALEQQVNAEQKRLDSPGWVLREPEESDLAAAELLVVDEVSMVGEDLAADLLSYGTKVLVLGDPAQLPPVDGAGYFIDARPDHLLTEIHRSALDSPVTRLATAVRNCAPGDRTYGIPGMDGDSGRTDELSTEDLLRFDQVLVGTNATRWEAIRLLRSLAGRTEPAPLPGDRIICLANSSEADVFNGQQFTVRTRKPAGRRDDRWKLSVIDEKGKTRDLTVWATGFRDLDGEREAKRKGRGAVAAATFAQAITTHKAQGSQWDDVLVVDASSTFYRTEYRQHVQQLGHTEAAARAHVNAQRWLYTAVTRAARRIVVVPQLPAPPT